VPAADDLDGSDNATVYDDGTVVRVSVRRTGDDAYPSGWRYTFHYGSLTAGPETLDDGTIRRYDNAHEETKGHERHVAPDPGPRDRRVPGDRGTLRAVLGRDTEIPIRSTRDC
jgi:hypothetical protein